MASLDLPATVASDGTATFTVIQGPSLGSWWAASFQVPGAPAAALFTLTTGGRTRAQWQGGSTFGPVELAGGDNPIQITATGLTAATQMTAVMHFTTSTSSPGALPAASAQAVDVSGSTVDITGPVTVNTGSNTPIDFQVSTNQQFLGSFALAGGTSGTDANFDIPPWAEGIIITASFSSGGVTSPAPVQITAVNGDTTQASLPVPRGGYVSSSGGYSFASAWLEVPVFGSIDSSITISAVQLDSGGATPTVYVSAVSRLPKIPTFAPSSATWVQESTTTALTVLPAATAYSAYELLSVNWSASSASNVQPTQLHVVGAGGGTVDTLQGPTLTTSGGEVTSSLDLHGLVVPAGGLVSAPALTVAGTWQGTLVYRRLI